MTDMTIEEELSITCEQRDALDIECARLEKEVDALRKDAERYRWLLRKGIHYAGNYAGNGVMPELVWQGPDWHDIETPEELEAAIDAAMRE